MEKQDLREAMIEADRVRHARHVGYAKAIGIPLVVIAAIITFVLVYDALDDSRNGTADFKISAGR